MTDASSSGAGAVVLRYPVLFVALAFCLILALVTGGWLAAPLVGLALGSGMRIGKHGGPPRAAGVVPMVFSAIALVSVLVVGLPHVVVGAMEKALGVEHLADTIAEVLFDWSSLGNIRSDGETIAPDILSDWQGRVMLAEALGVGLVMILGCAWAVDDGRAPVPDAVVLGEWNWAFIWMRGGVLVVCLLALWAIDPEGRVAAGGGLPSILPIVVPAAMVICVMVSMQLVVSMKAGFSEARSGCDNSGSCDCTGRAQESHLLRGTWHEEAFVRHGA